jgi:alkaline phosphatase D
MQVYRRLQWGRLANFHMLDTRQFRDVPGCNAGDVFQDCAANDDPARSLPGHAQEQWLAEGFASSRARWDVLGNQCFFGRRDSTATPDNTVSMQSWDGYPASRARVTDSWARAQVRNPIVLTGDVHAHWASEVLADFADLDSPVVGSEFVCSSISAGGNGYDEPTGQHPWAAYNPHLKFWTNLRGYVNARITPESFAVDYRCVPRVSVKGAAAFTRARFVVDDGVRGMRQVTENPPPAAAAVAPRSNARKIRDTVEAESR